MRELSKARAGDREAAAESGGRWRRSGAARQRPRQRNGLTGWGRRSGEEKVEWRSVFLSGPADFLWPPRDGASLPRCTASDSAAAIIGVFYKLLSEKKKIIFLTVGVPQPPFGQPIRFG